MSLSAAGSHTIRVKKLYRQGLKCLQNWCVHRDLFIEKGFALRAEFDANKGEANPKIIEKLVSDGEAKLADFEHPAPYTREPLPVQLLDADRVAARGAERHFRCEQQ